MILLKIAELATLAALTCSTFAFLGSCFFSFIWTSIDFRTKPTFLKQ
jgi:hypothetical protein